MYTKTESSSFFISNFTYLFFFENLILGKTRSLVGAVVISYKTEGLIPNRCWFILYKLHIYCENGVFEGT